MSKETLLNEEVVEKLTNKSKDLSKWYTEVIRLAELADYAPIKGCMVIRPYGYALWENIKEALDKKLKKTGHFNAYFPLLIPESFLKKEAEHIEGFAPQVAWVTQGGDNQLEEKLAIRPTSEAIICYMYAKWIRSWRDLPVLINQWANVLRWEMVTRPFLRTTEFLWQEGHTAHATEAQAEAEARMILEIYRELLEETLALPVLIGQKSESEKFAGALRTYTLEILMPDGQALQAGTSHNLGQHFAKAFNITFLDESQERKYVWQASWGVSTRLIGGVILVHGDDAGLILPPKIAPNQVVIIPIWQEKTKAKVKEKAAQIEALLKDKFRVISDLREGYTPGWKFNEHELRGVPLRIEIGPKDIQKNQVILARRDTRQEKAVPLKSLAMEVKKSLEEVQKNLFKQAKAFQDKNISEVKGFAEFKEILEAQGGFLLAGWCGKNSCESKVKEETTATIRLIPFSNVGAGVSAHLKGSAKCVYCGDKGQKVYFARAY